MNRDFLRRRYTDAHLVALDAQDGDGDVVADVDGFAYAAGEDEHCDLLGRWWYPEAPG
ncbi:hypothetical protein D3C84_1230450 [compost metagenome]